jgi:hypothetical protein
MVQALHESASKPLAAMLEAGGCRDGEPADVVRERGQPCF